MGAGAGSTSLLEESTTSVLGCHVFLCSPESRLMKMLALLPALLYFPAICDLLIHVLASDRLASASIEGAFVSGRFI